MCVIRTEEYTRAGRDATIYLGSVRCGVPAPAARLASPLWRRACGLWLYHSLKDLTHRATQVVLAAVASVRPAGCRTQPLHATNNYEKRINHIQITLALAPPARTHATHISSLVSANATLTHTARPLSLSACITPQHRTNKSVSAHMARARTHTQLRPWTTTDRAHGCDARATTALVWRMARARRACRCSARVAAVQHPYIAAARPPHLSHLFAT